MLDSLIGNPDAFPILARWDFFNHAGVAPLPRCAADALRLYAKQAEEQAYLESGWYRAIGELRQVAARLINAHRDEIALIKNTSEGVATVAAAIDWSPGDRVITSGVEYPANMYPWMDVARRFGVELVRIAEEPGPDGAARVSVDRILEAADHPRTRLVTLSHVQYASGQRLDIARVGRFCRSHGIGFCVDAIQTVGVLPVDVQAMCIDYLSADGHKWMLGPEGAGIFYCRRDLLPHTRPLIVGWLNVVNADDYGHYDYTLKPDAGRFECGTYSIPAFLGLLESLRLIESVGIDAIATRVRALTDRLAAGVRGKGYAIVSPRGEGEWSGGLSFTSPTHDHREIFRALRHQHHTEIAVREGRLRVSPHFYNTEAQIARLCNNLP